MNYADYLKVGTLLSLQDMESVRKGKPAHDEMLFIVMHQTYELWFRQILFELDLIQDVFGGRVVDDAELGRAVNAAQRIVKIKQLLVSQVDILENMTPMDFLEFRDLLIPSSVFQREQFRLLEIRLGLRKDARLEFNNQSFEQALDTDTQRRLRTAEESPSLRGRIDAWLSRTPFMDISGFRFRDSYRDALNRMLGSDLERIRSHPVAPASVGCEKIGTDRLIAAFPRDVRWTSR